MVSTATLSRAVVTNLSWQRQLVTHEGKDGVGYESNVALLSESVEAAVKAMLVENDASFYGNFIEVMVVIIANLTPQVRPYFSVFYFTPFYLPPAGDGCKPLFPGSSGAVTVVMGTVW